MSRDFDQFPVPALGAVAKKAGVNPFALVYMARTLNKVIVTPTVSPTYGLYVDGDPTAILAWDDAAEALGQQVWAALLRFRKAPARTDRKLTEWPAYRVSGAKSVRAFQQQTVQVSVEALPCVLRLEATVPVQAADGLFVGQYLTNACEFDTLGDTLFLLNRCVEHVVVGEYS